MKTQYYTATSIDGYLADEDNSLDWLFQFGDIEEIEGLKDDYPQFIDQVGAAAMGSTTYEWIVEHENLLADPEKWPYGVPVWVFSSRELPVVDGADIRFVQGDVAPVHADMVEPQTAGTSGSSVVVTSSDSSTITVYSTRSFSASLPSRSLRVRHYCRAGSPPRP